MELALRLRGLVWLLLLLSAGAALGIFVIGPWLEEQGLLPSTDFKVKQKRIGTVNDLPEWLRVLVAVSGADLDLKVYLLEAKAYLPLDDPMVLKFLAQHLPKDPQVKVGIIKIAKHDYSQISLLLWEKGFLEEVETTIRAVCRLVGKLERFNVYLPLSESY
jgi:hypothetical protein